MGGSVSIGELHGTVSLEDRFSNAFKVASGVVNGALDSMEGKFKNIAVIGGTVVGALVGIGGTIAALAVKGSHLNDLDRGFEKLAGSVENADAIMRAMERGTAKTVDSTKLLEFANRALQTGSIKTAEGFGTVTAAARVLSRQGLGSIESVMGTVNNALATGRTRQLQFLVGSIDLKAAEEKYAKSLGVTRDQLSAAGKLAADRIAIMDRLSQTVKNAGTVETSFAEKITAARLAIGNWFDDVAKAVAKSTSVNKAFDAIGEALVRNFGGGATTVAEALVRWINKFADMTAHYAPIVIDWIRRMYDWVVSMWQAVKRAWDQVPDWLKDIAKEALLAGVAFKATDVALGAIGGGDILGTLGSIGGAVSGLRDVFLSLVDLKIARWAIDWMKIFATFKFEGVILAVRSIGAAVMAWAGWPVATVLLMGTALYKMWTQWKEGETMWEFFSKGGGFWDNSMIGEWLGMSKAVDKTAESIDRLRKAGVGLMRSGKPLGAEFMLTSRQGSQWDPYPPEDPANQIEANSKIKAIADATNTSIKRTSALWRDYFALLDKSTKGELDQRLSAIDSWLDAEKEALDESKKTNKNYQNELQALESVAIQKRIDALKTLPALTSRQSAPLQGTLAGPLDERLLAQSLGRINLDARIIGDSLGRLIPTAAAKAQDAIVEAMNRSLAATKALTAEQKEYINSLHDKGMTNIEIADVTGLTEDQVRNGKSAGRAFREGFSGAIADFPKLLIDSLTGGGGVLNAFKALGANITNSLFGKGGSMESVTSGLAKSLSGGLAKMLPDGLSKALGSAISSLLPGVGALVGPLVDKIVSFFKGIGGPSKQELAGRGEVEKFQKQFASTEEMINRVGDAYATLGKTREQAQADIDAMWKAEKKGAEAAAEAIRKVEEALKRASEVDSAISGLGIKSRDELMHAADIAHEAYKKIAAGVETGQYTVEDATKAYRAYQEALAAAGDEAAKAWLKTQDAVEKGADAIDKAWSALQARKDELMKGIENEAWEPEIGVVERAAREEIARIDEQMKKSEEAAQKIENKFDVAAQNTEKEFNKTITAIGDGFIDMADGVVERLRKIFGDLKLKPTVEWTGSALPVPPPGGYRTPQHATFGAETDLAPDSFVGSASAGPQTITVRVPIDGRTLTEVTLDRLESGEYEQRSSELVGRLVRRR